jgi:hypothetical protein
VPLRRVRKLVEVLRPQIQELEATHAERSAGHDDVVLDAVNQSILYLRGNEPVWRARAELVGRFEPDLGMFRWWWVGRATMGTERMDAAYAEGQKRELAAFSQKQLLLEDAREARQLALLAALFAKADGLFERPGVGAAQGTTEYWALWDTWYGGRARPSLSVSTDTPSSSIPVPRAPSVPKILEADDEPRPSSVPPPVLFPGTLASISPPAFATMPPPSPVTIPPPSATGVAHPSTSVASLVGAALSRSGVSDYQQALLIVSVDAQGGKARFFAQLVALAGGELVAVDTTRELLTASGTLVARAAKPGAPPPRRITLRFVRGPTGEPELVSRR